MALNLAEARARITVQTEGQEKIAALSNSVEDLSAEVKRFAAEAAAGGNAASVMAGKAQTAASHTAAVGKSAGLAGHHMQNLAFQLNDVVVGLTSGQKPLTVFMQQGSQIGQIMAQAGMGVGGLVKSVLGAVAGFMRAHPVLLAVSAAAGVVSGAFGLMSDEINKNSKVHVTWADTALGTYDAVKSAISGALTKAFKHFGIDVGDVFKGFLSFTKSIFNGVIGFGVGAVKTIGATWKLLPAALGDAVLGAANLAISGMNTLISKAVGLLNSFIGAVAPMLAKFGINIGQVNAPQFGQIANPYAGSLSKMLGAGAAAFKGAMSTDYIGEFAAYVSPFAEARAVERMKKDAKKTGKEAGKEGGKAAGKGFLDGLEEQLNQDKAQLRGLMGDIMGQIANDNDYELAQMRAQMSQNTTKRTQPYVEAAKARLDSFGGGSLRGIQSYAEEIGSLGERAFATWDKALKGTEDALVNFAMTGKLSIKDLANSIIADLVRIAIQQSIMKPLASFLGLTASGGGQVASVLGSMGFANGAAFAGGNVVPFANGGVVTRPTLFPMARGTGLMGEAGPEAVMPLRRLSSGRLGVEAVGGGSTSVVVNVDANGSDVAGDQGRAGELGKAIASAVQAELVRQKRPGGLLTN